MIVSVPNPCSSSGTWARSNVPGEEEATSRDEVSLKRNEVRLRTEDAIGTSSLTSEVLVS